MSEANLVNLVTTYTTVCVMSRTHRKQPLRHQFRYPKTLNEKKQVNVSNNYYDSDYTVKIRTRYIPSAWDDITATSIYQNDHHS